MNKNENQMSKDAAQKKWWKTFEIVFGVPFLAAIALHLSKPIAFPDLFLILVIGIVLIVLGLILIVLSRRKFAQHNQPTDPGHPTSQLLTSGVFSISRNPLYLGGVCILFGIALVFKLTWALVFLVTSFIAAHYILILPEERYLTKKFGEKYTMYVASVNRWFGRKR